MLDKIRTIKAPFTRRFIERLIEKSVSQDEFGLRKYGKYLDPHDSYDWLNMAEEEFADLGKYLLAEREKRDAVLKNTLLSIRNFKEFAQSQKDIPPKFHEELNSFLMFVERDIRKLSRNLNGMEEKAGKD